MQQFSIILLLFLLQSCIAKESFNISDAKKTIFLDSKSLESYSKLKKELIKDLPLIKQKMPKDNHIQKWILINSFYLDQVDSIKYNSILSSIKGKYRDFILINDSGQIIFLLKEEVKMKVSDYNETFAHQLYSINSDYINSGTSNNNDTIFIDSIINSQWRYVARKYYSGH